MQANDSKWGIPQEMVIWISTPLIIILFAVLIGGLLPSVNRYFRTNAKPETDARTSAVADTNKVENENREMGTEIMP